MNWAQPEEKDDALKLPPNWLFIHYYEALNSLFRIENALRMLVFVVLKSQLGDGWQELSVSSDDGGDTTIHALSRRRAEQDQAFGYLGFTTNSPLMHLTSGELVRLLTSESYWGHFAPYFLASKSVVILKLQEIGNVRNALAHFRPLRKDDVEVVKQNANQVLSVVEKTLIDIIECAHRVPTNTEEKWFRELSALGTEAATVRLHQSHDSRWIRVAISYKCPILRQDPDVPSRYVSHEVLTISPTSILRSYEKLRTRVVIATENVSYRNIRQPVPIFTKDVLFTFPRRVLEEEYAELKPIFEDLLSQVASEGDLISGDNLAQGRIVRLVNVTGRKEQIKDIEYWDFDTRNLSTLVSADDPPEYWGEVGVWTRNFVTNTKDYPWMPAPVSFASPLL